MGNSPAYKADLAAAHDAVYASKGLGENPFPSDSRRARMWDKKRQHFLNMECLFDEMAQAYGEFRPDRIKLVTKEKTQ